MQGGGEEENVCEGETIPSLTHRRSGQDGTGESHQYCTSRTEALGTVFLTTRS